VDEVGELDGVPDEEDRSVVADEVVIALLGIELQREAARVTHRVRRTEIAGHRGEAEERLGLLPGSSEELRPGVPRHVGGQREGAVGPRTARVHDALRNAFAIEVRQLLQKELVLDQGRSPGTSGLTLLVVRDRGAGFRRQRTGGPVLHRHVLLLLCTVLSFPRSYIGHCLSQELDEFRTGSLSGCRHW
jgi:hypothetical protein